jgi:hypothetical protein
MELGKDIPRELFASMVDCAQARQIDLHWLCELYRAGIRDGNTQSVLPMRNLMPPIADPPAPGGSLRDYVQRLLEAAEKHEADWTAHDEDAPQLQHWSGQVKAYREVLAALSSSAEPAQDVKIRSLEKQLVAIRNAAELAMSENNGRRRLADIHNLAVAALNTPDQTAAPPAPSAPEALAELLTDRDRVVLRRLMAEMKAIQAIGKPSYDEMIVALDKILQSSPPRSSSQAQD